jgi:hydrogenase expression/formation protein HypE
MSEFHLSCPVPGGTPDRIGIAHGGGGRMTQRLIDQIFKRHFSNPALDAAHDGAVVSAGSARLAFTTDSYVVQPIVFPGGTIGDLAVNGTVNDLAMCGARPLSLSAAFILEEGLAMADLESIVVAMRDAAHAAGVPIVTGDTKVVERGKADRLFITTSGIGVIEPGVEISPARVRPGDAILVSGDLGAHGIAILSVREGLEFEGAVASDTAPVWRPVQALLAAGIDVHCLRDLTRGGLASALNEIAVTAKLSFTIDEEAIPVGPVVRGACELLGLDPLYVANEGRFTAIVAASDAGRALDILRDHDVSRRAVLAGEVGREAAGLVMLRSRIGGSRVLDMLSGQQLPRIC